MAVLVGFLTNTRLPKEPPENLSDRVQMYSGHIRQLVETLEKEGYKHAYVDGGKTIQSFLVSKWFCTATIQGELP